MDTEESLGTCPDCRMTVPRSRLLVQYESSAGVALIAKYSNFRSIVYPE